MILSLKISASVYESFSSVNYAETTTYTVDFDENEGEEKKELDEHQKIHQPLETVNLPFKRNSKNKLFSNYSKLKTLYFEYTTPPPEFS